METTQKTKGIAVFEDFDGSLWVSYSGGEDYPHATGMLLWSRSPSWCRWAVPGTIDPDND
jgi:hypothetical protein